MPDRMCAAQVLVLMDVSISSIGLDDAGATWLQGTGGHYFLTGRNLNRLCCDNDFKLKEKVPACYFACLNDMEPSSVYMRPASKNLAREHTKVLAVLWKTLPIQNMRFPPKSWFFGHTYMQVLPYLLHP